MKTRTILYLVGALGLLALIAVLGDRLESRRQSSADLGKLLKGLETAKVAKVTVKVGATAATLVKKEGAWRVDPEGFAADDAAVKAALEALDGMQRGEVAAKNPEKHALLEVKEGDAKTVDVQVWTDAGDKPAYHVLVGKAGGDYQSNFVRLAGEDVVYRTAKSVRSSFDRGQLGWRDRTVLKFEPESARRLELKSLEGGTIVLERNDDKTPWRITAPEAAAAKATQVDTVLRTLSNLQADGFAAAGTDPAAHGLVDAVWRSKVTLADGKTFEVSWGADASPGKVYAKRGDTDTVYEVGAYRKTSVFSTLADLREAPAPAASPAAEAVAVEPSASPTSH